MDDAGLGTPPRAAHAGLVPLSSSKSAPHLSWRTSGRAKLAAIEKNWELTIPLRPDLRKQLKQQRTGIWRDATQVRYDESGPRSNPGPVPRRSTAAPNPAAGFASPVLSCELSLAESLSRDQVRRGGTPGSSSTGPSNGSAEECLAALARLAEIVPAAFSPVLRRVTGALEPLIFSSEFTDSDGRRMPYAQFVQTVSRKWVLDAQAAESLAKQDLARAMLEVESLEARVSEAESRAGAAEAAREDAREESAAATSRVADLEREVADLAREVARGRPEAAVAVAVKVVAALDLAAASSSSMVPRAELEALKEECREVRSGGRDGGACVRRAGWAGARGGEPRGGGWRSEGRRVRGGERGRREGRHSFLRCYWARVAAGDAALGVTARADLRAGAQDLRAGAQPAAREAREGRGVASRLHPACTPGPHPSTSTAQVTRWRSYPLLPPLGGGAAGAAARHLDAPPSVGGGGGDAAQAAARPHCDALRVAMYDAVQCWVSCSASCDAPCTHHARRTAAALQQHGGSTQHCAAARCRHHSPLPLIGSTTRCATLHSGLLRLRLRLLRLHLLQSSR